MFLNHYEQLNNYMYQITKYTGKGTDNHLTYVTLKGDVLVYLQCTIFF